MGPRTSREAREVAVRLFIAGEATADELADQHGVRPSTVWTWVQSYAGARGLENLKPTVRQQLKIWTASGLIAGSTTQEEIVKRLKEHRNEVKQRQKPRQERPRQLARCERVPWEVQRQAVKQYLAGKATAKELAARHGVSLTTIHYWARVYRTERGLV
jgi:transposase-like protein